MVLQQYRHQSVSTFFFLCVTDQPSELLYTSCQSQQKNDYTPHEPDIKTVNNVKQMCKARGK